MAHSQVIQELLTDYRKESIGSLNLSVSSNETVEIPTITIHPDDWDVRTIAQFAQGARQERDLPVLAIWAMGEDLHRLHVVSDGSVDVAKIVMPHGGDGTPTSARLTLRN